MSLVYDMWHASCLILAYYSFQSLKRVVSNSIPNLIQLSLISDMWFASSYLNFSVHQIFGHSWRHLHCLSKDMHEVKLVKLCCAVIMKSCCVKRMPVMHPHFFFFLNLQCVSMTCLCNRGEMWDIHSLKGSSMRTN